MLIASWARPTLAADPASDRASALLDVQRGAGTERCIAAPVLKRGVEARLHRAIFELDERAAFRIHLRLAYLAARKWSAELEMETKAGVQLGQRTIVTNAADCSSLDDSITLVVALLVDAPLSATGNSPPEPTSQAEPLQSEVGGRRQAPPASPPRTTPIDLPRDTHAPRAPWRWEGSLGAAFALGLLPGVPWGVELGIGAKPAHAPELRLFAGAYQPRDANAGEGGAHFNAQHLGLELCPVEERLAGVRLSLCAGQSVGRMHVSAFGYDQNSSMTRLTFAVFARGALGIALSGPLSLRIAGRLEAPLTRAVFTYGRRDQTEANVFQVAPAVGVMEAGFSVAL